MQFRWSDDVPVDLLSGSDPAKLYWEMGDDRQQSRDSSSSLGGGVLVGSSAELKSGELRILLMLRSCLNEGCAVTCSSKV